MANRTSFFRRLWSRSPRISMNELRDNAAEKAKRIIPTVEDWNINWLGEEMRPFNSLHNPANEAPAVQ